MGWTVTSRRGHCLGSALQTAVCCRGLPLSQAQAAQWVNRVLFPDWEAWGLGSEGNGGLCWRVLGCEVYPPHPEPSAQPNSLFWVTCVNADLNFLEVNAPARHITITAHLLLLQIRTHVQGGLALSRITWPVASRAGLTPQLLAPSQTDSLAPHTDRKCTYKCLPGGWGAAGGQMDGWVTDRDILCRAG